MLPRWCTDMLRDRARRHGAMADGNGARPVFPAPLGGWRDPSNTQADLRDAFAAAGFDWVTSHAFRKTVATLMDHAGLSARAAADQLGHANTSMTTDVYFGRKVAATGAAAVLEALGYEKSPGEPMRGQPSRARPDVPPAMMTDPRIVAGLEQR
jgi:integrase